MKKKDIEQDENISHNLKVHTGNVLSEVFNNSGTWALKIPLQTLSGILQEAAMYASTTGDEKMIGYFCRLTIYSFNDPQESDYNREKTQYFIDKTSK